jgi:hypothetical protein
VTGADRSLTNTLNDIEAQSARCTKGTEVSALVAQARSAAVVFLSSVSATEATQPFDLTFMLENPDFDNDATTGWTSNNGAPGYDAKGAEFYEKTFNFYQVLDNMPAGNYELRANAFQRPGATDAVYAPYNKGTANVTTSLYLNSTAAAVRHICDDRQPSALFNDGGWGSDVQLADGTYIPNCMTGAEKYFDRGLYDSSVSASLVTAGESLRLGIKCTSAPSAYWTMFDHFRLHFFGGGSALNAIRQTTADGWQTTVPVVYDLIGRRITGSLASGIYLVNGKKVLINKK